MEDLTDLPDLKLAQCCADVDYITGGNVRCTEQAIRGSSHCIQHNPMAVKSFLAYKRSCNKLNTLNIDSILASKDVKKIMRLYALSHRAYIGRLKHRAYSFTEEFHDKGHGYQLKRLNRLMQRTEIVLSKLFEEDAQLLVLQEIYDKEEDLDEDDVCQVGGSLSIPSLRDERENYKHKVENDIALAKAAAKASKAEEERVVRQMLERYEEEALQNLKYKYDIMDAAVKTVVKMRVKVYDTEDICQCVACTFNATNVIFNITQYLKLWGVFEKGYVPQTCKCGGRELHIHDRHVELLMQPVIKDQETGMRIDGTESIIAQEFFAYCYNTETIKDFYRLLVTNYQTIYRIYHSFCVAIVAEPAEYVHTKEFYMRYNVSIREWVCFEGNKKSKVLKRSERKRIGRMKHNQIDRFLEGKTLEPEAVDVSFPDYQCCDGCREYLERGEVPPKHWEGK